VEWDLGESVVLLPERESNPWNVASMPVFAVID
jgi:hypothetical protein